MPGSPGTPGEMGQEAMPGFMGSPGEPGPMGMKFTIYFAILNDVGVAIFIAQRTPNQLWLRQNYGAVGSFFVQICKIKYLSSRTTRPGRTPRCRRRTRTSRATRQGRAILPVSPPIGGQDAKVLATTFRSSAMIITFFCIIRCL